MTEGAHDEVDDTSNSVDDSDPVERACLLQERAVDDLAAGNHAEAERLLAEAVSLVAAADPRESGQLDNHTARL